MPSWKELKRFCEKDKWELYKTTDHYYFKKLDKNKELKFTKVSKGTGEINRNLFNKILKKQLKVDKTYFNKFI